MFSQSQQSPSCYLMTMHCKLADNVDNKAGPLALLVCTASMKHWEINTVTLPMIRLGNPAISSSYNCWIWIRKRRWEWGRGKEDRGRMHAQSYMMQHKLCQLLILAQWKFIFLKTHLRAIDHMLRGKLYRLIAMSWYSKKKSHLREHWQQNKQYRAFQLESLHQLMKVFKPKHPILLVLLCQCSIEWRFRKNLNILHLTFHNKTSTDCKKARETVVSTSCSTAS